MAFVTGSTRSVLMISALSLGLGAGSLLVGCDQADPVSASVAPVTIGGKKFYLEIAADNATRMRGMGGRDHVEAAGGMIFTFPPSQVRVQEFVMRDCVIDLDILYLDAVGRVLTTYTMKADPRKKDGSEGKDGEIGTPAAQKYEDRLKRYSSRFPAHFVVEIKAGSIERLGVKEGDQLTFDVAGLKKRAR